MVAVSAGARSLSGAARGSGSAREPTREGIEHAARTIDRRFRDTPQFEHPTMNEAVGCRLTCKVETLNPIGSFKGRGSDHLLRCMGSEHRGIVCASAGNFGQGMAYAARRRGVPLTVFAAEGASPAKIRSMRAWGAEVRLHGADLDAAKEAARHHAHETGLRFVEDGREPEVTEGAGTIAVELGREEEPLDAVVVPLGNGALVNGIGTWFRSARPATRVIAVAADGAPAMERSWRAGRSLPTERVHTIADGIAVREPVLDALATMRRVVDEVWLVSDDALLRAMRLAFRGLGLVLEPAGAAGLAGVLARPERVRGLRLAVPLCGANLTDEQRLRWLG